MANATATTTTNATGVDREFGPGLGDTQRALLLGLKRLGPATQAELGREVPFTPGTLREHLHALAALGVIRREGVRRGKPGRPEVVFALTPAGESLFPRREAEILRDLVSYLVAQGHTGVIDAFWAADVGVRRPAALARVRSLRGGERFAEVARMMSEQGFMAQVRGAGSQRTLRLCHCPIAAVVAVTQAPCRHEERLLGELLGGPVTRTAYLPDGQGSCSYVSRRRSRTTRTSRPTSPESP
jgi:predicted ArsR family transcriptional regulator